MIGNWDMVSWRQRHSRTGDAKAKAAINSTEENRGRADLRASGPPSGDARQLLVRRAAMVALPMLLTITLVLAAIALAGCSSQTASSAGQQTAVTPAEKRALAADAATLEAGSSSLSEDLGKLKETLESARHKALNNERDFVAWQEERAQDLAEWKKKKRAIDRYNADLAPTPPHTQTMMVKTWDPELGAWVTHEETEIVPGQPSSPLPYPPRPKKPDAITASLATERRALKSLAASLKQTSSALIAGPTSAELGDARASLTAALALLTVRVEQARRALASATRVDEEGQIIKQNLISSLTIEDAADAVERARQTLKEELQALGLATALPTQDGAGGN